MAQTMDAVFARYPIVHQWIPYYCVWYREERKEWYVHSPRATYADLVRARAGAVEDQARAQKRRQFRARTLHTQRVAMFDMVLETFGSLMAQHPTMTLAEACGDTPPPEQGSAPRLPPGYTHPLRRVREL